MKERMIRTFFLFTAGLILIPGLIAGNTLTYHLSMSDPHTHYFQVEMIIEGNTDSILVLKMPVWTPGSYLVREFSRHIPNVIARTSNHLLKVKKSSKNEWRIITEGNETISVQYNVYAFEQSVRTSFLNDSRGYVNGASVFLYIEGRIHEPGELKIHPYKRWHVISTGLPKVPGKFHTYRFDTYDILIDSPILIGNHNVLTFTVEGISHEIALYGQSNMDKKKFVEDVQKIVETCEKLWGSLPYPNYVFIIFMLEKGRGGLEHLNSTSIEINRWIFSDEKKYKNFLALVAHEFFHTWNVKRIRPIALGPFDYSNENYTEDLWISEGITSYYEYIILLRAGIISVDEFLNYLSKQITSVETTPGKNVQSLSESSFDTWIKYYRQDENSPNTLISYYSKGSLIGMLLDLAIIENSGSRKSLDDVLRLIYEEITVRQNRGFKSTEFREACESIAGRKLNDIWKYVDTTDSIDYNLYLSPFGCILERSRNHDKNDTIPYWGFRTIIKGDKIVVKNIYDGTPAYKGGLNVNDEIIALNGVRANDLLLSQLLKEIPVGKKAEFLISREGNVKTIILTPISTPFNTFTIKKMEEASDLQKTFFQAWTQSE